MQFIVTTPIRTDHVAVVGDHRRILIMVALDYQPIRWDQYFEVRPIIVLWRENVPRR